MVDRSNKPYVVADKLTDLEEDRLNYFLKTWQKEFSEQQKETNDG